MDRIQGKTFTGERVILDDHEFVECVFDNCDLIYSGGQVIIDRIKRINCKVHLLAAAGRTIDLMRAWKLDIGDFPNPITVQPPAGRDH